MTFKLMLAGKADVARLTYPLLASPKLDGVRAAVQNGIVVSRNLRPIPNKWVQLLFGNPNLEGCDGELIVGDPTAKDCFRRTQGDVMRVDGKPQVTFYVFDRHQPYNSQVAFGLSIKKIPFDEWLQDNLYRQRYEQLQKHIAKARRGLARWPAPGNPNLLVPCLQLLEHFAVDNQEMLKNYELDFVNAGYEGIMLRSPYGPYKQGRSTAREGYLLKLKRFEDAEAVVIGVEEQMHNNNLHTLQRAGKAVRSTHKAGMQGTGVLGALTVRGLNGAYKGVEFSLGSGFTVEERQALWQGRLRDVGGQNRSPLGCRVRYKYFPGGSKTRPRFPVFAGFRDTK